MQIENPQLFSPNVLFWPQEAPKAKSLFRGILPYCKQTQLAMRTQWTASPQLPEA